VVCFDHICFRFPPKEKFSPPLDGRIQLSILPRSPSDGWQRQDDDPAKTGQLLYQADRLWAVFLFPSSCRQQPTDSNRTSASNDQLPLELARSILYLAMGAGCGTRLSSHRYRAKLKRQYPLAAACFSPPLKTERQPVTCARSKSCCGRRNRPTAPPAPPAEAGSLNGTFRTRRDG
jgi:hypothetical protein